LDTVEPTSFQSLDSEPISYPSQEELTPIILSTPTGIRARTHGLVGQSMDYPGTRSSLGSVLDLPPSPRYINPARCPWAWIIQTPIDSPPFTHTHPISSAEARSDP
jgi:hypothetical protein